MDQESLAQKWQKLCIEHDVARDAYFAVFASVNSKFAAIGAGTSSTNPTEEESAMFESTLHAWQKIQARMAAFVNSHG